jgi:hypothetical protein
MLKQTLEKLMVEHNKLNEAVFTNELRLSEVIDKIDVIQDKINNISDQPDISKNADYQKLLQDKSLIQQQINDLGAQAQSIIRKLQEEVYLLNQDISAREKSIALVNQKSLAEKRVKELEAQEKVLSAEFEDLEKQLYLTEQFIRAKVNLLENRINSKFKLARFKLFNQQINGGLEECCDTLGEGVAWSSGLNNAARINIGLDIINTLFDHYNFMAPIFVDNAEAVSKLIETKSQIIRLVVSEPDKTLRIEYDNGKNKLKEAI